VEHLMNAFYSFGQLPEAGPLQPPTPVGRPPHPVSDEEKAEAMVAMMRKEPYRTAMLDVLADLSAANPTGWQFFVTALVTRDDIAAGTYARTQILETVEAVMKREGTEWEDFL
jgi:hypothetical protein